MGSFAVGTDGERRSFAPLGLRHFDEADFGLGHVDAQAGGGGHRVMAIAERDGRGGVLAGGLHQARRVGHHAAIGRGGGELQSGEEQRAEGGREMRHDLHAGAFGGARDAQRFGDAAAAQVGLDDAHGAGTEERRHLKMRAVTLADGQRRANAGSERGMMLNPRVWRERIKPFSGRLITTFKQMGLKTFYHSCGSIVPVIDDFIELGLDILDPIQVSAAGMSPEAISAFADRLSFHGAIDEVRLLPHATAAEVYRETTRVINVLGRCGGFIVSPSHQVQGDTPPENIVAVFDAAHDYRWK